ncbi:MAG: hypothetical protein ACJ74Q_15590 [Pyrinomonadaceae bacterium]
MNFAQDPEHTHEEVSALVEAAHEAGAADTSADGYAPRALGVYIEPGADADPTSLSLQLAFAVEAAARLGLRVAILLADDSSGELPALTLRAAEINPGVTVGELTYESGLDPEARDKQVTLVTGMGLRRILCHDGISIADLFDVVVVPEGYAFRPWHARDYVRGHFSRAKLVIVFTGDRPSEEIVHEHSTLAGRATIFDAAYLESFLVPKAVIDRCYRPRPDEALSQTLRGLRAEHPYSSLPPSDEVKIATIGELDLSAPAAADVPRPGGVAPGMYIIVPEHFPRRCLVVATAIRYLAHHHDGETIYQFAVWPATTVGAAWEAYEGQRASGSLQPDEIGSVVTPYTEVVTYGDAPRTLMILAEERGVGISLNRRPGRSPLADITGESPGTLIYTLVEEEPESFLEVIGRKRLYLKQLTDAGSPTSDDDLRYRRLLPPELVTALEEQGFKYLGESPVGGTHIRWEKQLLEYTEGRKYFSVFVRVYMEGEYGEESVSALRVYGQSEFQGKILTNNSNNRLYTDVEGILKAAAEQERNLLDEARDDGLLPTQVRQ